MNQPVKITLFIIISWLLIFYTAAYAAKPPANIIKYKQPDGSFLYLTLHGDEYLSYYKTTSGEVVAAGRDGFFYHATIDGEGIRSSGARIIPQNKTKSGAVASSENLHILSDLRQKRINELKRASVQAAAPLPVSGHGVKRLSYLVVPVQFKDVKFTIENPKDFFSALLNQKGYSYDGATGSAADYFNENFGGVYSFSFTVADIVTLDKELSHYGQRNSTAADANVEELVISVCESLSTSGTDFSQYDNNSDGYIDNIAIIFAGTDEAQSANPNSIWPQRGDLSYKNIIYGGVKPGSYTCTPELNCNGQTGEFYPATIGLFCHEFSHALGLPDLYDANAEIEGLASALYGSLSIMDYGCYLNQGRTPPYFNSIEREILGIGEVVEVVAGERYSLSGVEAEDRLYRLSTENDGEYFLIECRNRERWDRYCGADGIVVYHIDKSDNICGGLSAARRWELNIINSYAAHECAKVLFPPTENSFSQLSYHSPSPLKDWSGRPLGIRLSNVNYNGATLDFSVEDDTKWSSEAVEIKNATIVPYNEDAHIKWSFASDADTLGGVTNLYWRNSLSGELFHATTNGNDYLISPLEPGAAYNVELFFEKESKAGNPYKVKFKSDTITSPFPYLKIRGEYKSGERLYLRVLNRGDDVLSVKYIVNGMEYADYITFNSVGLYVVEAIVEYSDRSRDIIKKIVRVTE